MNANYSINLQLPIHLTSTSSYNFWSLSFPFIIEMSFVCIVQHQISITWYFLASLIQICSPQFCNFLRKANHQGNSNKESNWTSFSYLRSSPGLFVRPIGLGPVRLLLFRYLHKQKKKWEDIILWALKKGEILVLTAPSGWWYFPSMG